MTKANKTILLLCLLTCLGFFLADQIAKPYVLGIAIIVFLLWTIGTVIFTTRETYNSQLTAALGLMVFFLLIVLCITLVALGVIVITIEPASMPKIEFGTISAHIELKKFSP
jgi:hypothetical protein